MSKSILTYFDKKSEKGSKKRKADDDIKSEEPAKKKQKKDSEQKSESEVKSNLVSNLESNVESNVESNAEANLESNLESNSQSNANITYENCEKLLNKTWSEKLKNEFKKSYYLKLKKTLKKVEESGVKIFPPIKEVFAAFDYCPFNELKAVIIGQDPYHDNGQAEGLCFSVKKGIKIPSSLRNMYKEAGNDDDLKIKFTKPNHGSLISWAKEGVLLLNTVLTVEAHKANSHKKFGWQTFTDSVIKLISNKHDGCVFICWGKQAQKKIAMIDTKKHRIVKSAHPSGLSASRGFYGSKPYSKTNKLLRKLGKQPIDWSIKDKE